ncbi:MAG: LysM peptidoglycan-binding domain-containing protein [Phycisphaerales bacterium]
MTREHKLALIFGFALVLVVGLLISDNFSASRQTTPGGPSTAEAQQPIMREDVLVGDGATNKPTITAAPIDGVMPGAHSGALAGGPESTLPPNGVSGTNQPVSAEPDTLAFGNRIEDAWTSAIDDLSNGHASTPAAAETDRVSGGTITNPANPASSPLPQPTPMMPAENVGGLSTPESAPYRSNGVDGPGGDTSDLGVRPSQFVSPAPAPRPVPAEETSTKSTDKRHQIAEGDSFWKLAAKYYNDGKLAEALKSYNKDRIGKNGQLRVGASLMIPEKSALTGAKSAKATEPKTAAKPEPKNQPKAEKKSDLKVPNRDTIAAAKDNEKKSTRASSYTVKKGDTLEKIAVKFLGSASRIDDLMRANRGVLDNEDDLQAGQVLKIPAR